MFFKLVTYLFLTGLLVVPVQPATAQDKPAEQPTAQDDLKSQEAPQTTPVESFGFGKVVALARELASRPYESAEADLPAAIANIDYDTYRKLRFRPDRALWHGERFEVQFFHPGFLFKTPVRINVIEDGRPTTLSVNKEMFDYEKTGLDAAITDTLDFAGFRVHYPLNTHKYKDELIVFQGASYFRVLGRGQLYGLSARGLAVDTGMPSGEEFPLFKEFWLVTPEPEATTLTVYALLDSVRVSGAYQFVIHPGTDTRVEVSARLFVRDDIDKLGIAPLTSMYLFGENAQRTFDDHRPEVHDSDGLLMLSGSGQWMWRPLVNDRNLRISAFMDNNPRGFGLMQRDRHFDNYQDLEAHYHRRPSFWIEPTDDWGEGSVELVEIPSNEEIHDNIVAFWVGRQPVRAGQDLKFSYALVSTLREPANHRLAQAVATRIGAAIVPGAGAKRKPDKRLFVVEFNGGDLPFMSGDQEIEADLTHSAGRISDLTCVHVPETGAWQARFRLDMDGSDTVELALKLMVDNAPVTETWMYRFSPHS